MAVFFYLQSIASYNPAVFFPLVKTARSRHATPDLCDRLLAAEKK
jgi:hypothetical protein